MKTRPINKSNPKNIYCGHCEFFNDSGNKMYGQPIMICNNPEGRNYLLKRYYYHRCKCFMWKRDADYATR